MNNSPLVSICIPTYNGVSFLQEALNSVSAQEYKNIEVVVSDDQSSDGTLEILERFRKSVTIPVTIKRHTPSGIGANWNHTIALASGEYIKFLFQDDILKKDCISKMVEIAQQDPDIVLVYSKRNFIYDTTNSNHTEWIATYASLHVHWDGFSINDTAIHSGRKLLRDKNLLKSPVNKIGEPPATLLRRTAIEKAGYFDQDLKQALDIEYWYRIMNYGKVAFINEPLITFRLHEEQASAVNLRNDVNEQFLLEKSLGKHIFWRLHPSYRKDILYRHYYVGKIWKNIKSIFSKEELQTA